MIACAELKTFGNFLKFSSGPVFSTTRRENCPLTMVKRIDFIAATGLVKNVKKCPCVTWPGRQQKIYWNVAMNLLFYCVIHFPWFHYQLRCLVRSILLFNFYLCKVNIYKRFYKRYMINSIYLFITNLSKEAPIT